MKNSHIPNSDTLVDEVEVEPNMLRMLVLYGVSREVYGTNCKTQNLVKKQK
jgi:hypothetical protein